MSTRLLLPRSDGTLTEHEFGAARHWPLPDAPPRSRIALAAAHVVPKASADNTPGAPAQLDWEATLSFRHHLWSYGLGVAEAMDTAQRGMGLDWPAARELIHRSSAEARACGGRIAAGVSTDHMPEANDLDAIAVAYERQLEEVEDAGALPILMASRQLAAHASTPDDYHRVYGRLLGQTSQPVILHWLGPMFDPSLTGYWGANNLDEATNTFLGLVAEHAGAIDGVKISLLDADREIAIRDGLPEGVRLYTGDDFNYPRLILGDERRYSDALLGIFAAIAPAASAALQALDAGDLAAYDNILSPTVPLARLLFEAPTFRYKTGIAFLSWLSGHQDGFVMLGGMQSARSIVHLAEVLRLADAAGLLPDPELATERMRRLLKVSGL